MRTDLRKALLNDHSHLRTSIFTRMNFVLNESRRCLIETDFHMISMLTLKNGKTTSCYNLSNFTNYCYGSPYIQDFETLQRRVRDMMVAICDTTGTQPTRVPTTPTPSIPPVTGTVTVHFLNWHDGRSLLLSGWLDHSS